LLRKALIQLHLNQTESARETLRHLLQNQPGHLGGSILMTRLAFDSEGPEAGVAQFQQALSAHRAEDRSQLASLASFLGSNLGRSGYPQRGSSISSWLVGFQVTKRNRSPRNSRICGAVSPFRSGRRTPIVSLRRRKAPRRPSANRSRRRWAGPKSRSGRRPLRPSNCWQRAQGGRACRPQSRVVLFVARGP